MKKPFYGYPRRLNWQPIAGLCFGVCFGLIAWCAIWCLVRDAWRAIFN